MSDVTVTQLSQHLAEYLDRVELRRETFTLIRGNKRLAELRPLPRGARLSELPALVASLPHLSSSEATEFADDLAAAQSEIWTPSPTPPRSAA